MHWKHHAEGKQYGELLVSLRIVRSSVVYGLVLVYASMSIDIQKWKAEAHENAAKTVANMLQVGLLNV